MTITIINAEEVRKLLPMADCIDAVDRAMRATSSGKVAIPPRIIAPLVDGSAYFGLMPGSIYGWPKNVLHTAGIHESILDINATVQPQIAIVDGIVGMEGDGPIMGTPIHSGVLVIGRNLPAVDATCARIMGLNPEKIGYLARAPETLGPTVETVIEQRGETIDRVRKPYSLLDKIPAFRDLRLV